MFAPYLTQPIETPDQQAAFDEILAFLDGVPAINPALIEEMQRAFSLIDAEAALKLRRAKESAAADPQTWFRQNEAAVLQYAAYKQSSAYRNSPAMRRLSPVCDAYYRQLIAANNAFSRALETT